MKKIVKFLLALWIGIIGIGTVSAEETSFEGEVVRVGVVGELYEEIWKYVAEKAKEEEGIEIEVVLLTDYNIPNVALSDGSIDLNAFQHDVFLENWNQENDGSIVTLGYTVAVPTRVYSEKYASLEELPEGAKIAVNAAPTSLGYNLQSLERAGLITLADNGELLPTVDDIAENPKNLEIIELDGSLIPPAVPDVDAAFIDNSFLAATNFKPSDAIYVFGDTPETINVDRVNNIAAREEDRENPLYLKIVELFQQDDVAEVIEEVTDGGSIAAWDIVAAVQDSQE